MLLWLISRIDKSYHDGYREAVVVARSPEEAKYIHPSKYHQTLWINNAWHEKKGNGSFVTNEYVGQDWTHPDGVEVEFIGFGLPGLGLNTVICCMMDSL